MQDTKATDRIQVKLGNWKVKLIDLTKRNRLLNYKEVASSNVKLDEHPDEIYQLLEQGKAIQVNTVVNLKRFKTKSSTKKNKKDAPAHQLTLVEEENEYIEQVDIFDIDFEEDDDFDNDGVDLDQKRAIARLENILNKIRLKAKSSARFFSFNMPCATP